jgi:GNAT superfamily N-acetyltransferase
MTTGWEVRPLGPDTWASYAEFVEHCDGFPSGCWCMEFHPEGQEKKGDYASANRERKRARVMSGEAHAALVFDGGSCVGWCQFGPADELTRIKGRSAYERSRTTALPDWRIACFYVAKRYRREGISHVALEGALRLISEGGGGTVEGYPEPVDAVPAGFLYNGALSTFEQLGFQRDRMIGKHRWVVVRDVKPAS